jgi:hypothetical protein
MRKPIRFPKPSGRSKASDCNLAASQQLGEISPAFCKRAFNIFINEFIATSASNHDSPTLGFVARREQTLQLKFNPLGDEQFRFGK